MGRKAESRAGSDPCTANWILNQYAVAPGRGYRSSGRAFHPGGIAPARGGLLSAAPCSNASIEVERLAVHDPGRSDAGVMASAGSHPLWRHALEVCVPALIFHREGCFPRERRHQLWERASEEVGQYGH